jgi:polysaccharide deacetylase 2 family uncharacterized protein YibQ
MSSKKTENSKNNKKVGSKTEPTKKKSNPKITKGTKSVKSAKSTNTTKKSKTTKSIKKKSPVTRKKGTSARNKNSNLKYKYDTKSVIALIFSVISFIASISILIYVVLDDTQEDKIETSSSKNSTQIAKDKKSFFEENYEFLFEEKENKEHEKVYEPSKKELELLEKKREEEKEKLAKELLEQLAINKTKLKEKRKEKKETKPTIKKEEIKSITTTIQKRHKDKLAIIIDDITYQKHLEFSKLGININLSFLPPTHGHPSSAKLAKKMDSYLVHLPCQAKSKFFKEEENTLHIYDDYSTIENRIYELKKMYPKAKVMNNHTGSLFTQDKASMDRLMRALQKYDLKFIDSRTTAKSVANIYADKYGVPILSRNVFLDNKRDKEFIKKNIVKSVKLAHRFGQAIAIGHPYKLTLQSIKELRDYLKDEVELVLVNRLDYNNE